MANLAFQEKDKRNWFGNFLLLFLTSSTDNRIKLFPASTFSLQLLRLFSDKLAPVTTKLRTPHFC
jgi:hypothetical protein